MTNATKTNVGVLFGGRSGEHEISLCSARSIVAAIDRERYDVTLIGIDHRGRWRQLADPEFESLTVTALPSLHEEGQDVAMLPMPSAERHLVSPATGERGLRPIDVAFPILHGTFGEDGTIQGLLELADIPYVGAGVLGSAVGMDKDVQKRLLRDAGMALLPFITVQRQEYENAPGEVRERAVALGLPLFVKPANLGSSVGISKVADPSTLDAAIVEALSYDDKIVIEKGIDAREIECAVLGNESPQASIPGEIDPQREFYSYEAKYLDDKGALLIIPARIDEAQTREVQRQAIEVFRRLDCTGMARVDFLLDRHTGELFVNELNSIPGFTTISMYPKLWEHSGLPYSELIDRLLQLAIERHNKRSRLRRSFK